jgi:hypothetical protein
MIKTVFDLLNLSQKAKDGLNESASKKGYPPVFIGYSLNTEYRFVVSNDHVGTVWRWFPPGIYVDKVMFYYLPKGEKHEVWLFTDGRIS